MSVSNLDKVYRKMVLTKFFTKGWGNPQNLVRLFAFRKLVANRDSCFHLVSKDHPITIISKKQWSDCTVIEGKFRSPFAAHLPDIVPPEVEDAYFQMILPLTWKSSKFRPICIHLAGTGDHYYWRRRNIMAKPLLKSNIGSILLENPFYGLRKPKDQIRSCLHNVSDIFIMGGCLILESLALLHWLEQQGFGPLGLSGLSMGGHMASLAATCWPKPLVLVPCLSWSTASPVFTQGVMSESIDWNLLENQYSTNSLFYETLANMATVIDKDCYLRSLLNTSSNKESEKTEEDNKFILSSLLQLFSSSKVTDRTNNVNEIRQSGLLPPNMTKSIKFPAFFMRNLNDQKIHPLLTKPRDAVYFMRSIMDEFTHLKNFSVPYDTSLITVVCAEADGYVPREGCYSLEEIWPGATIRYIDAGHVSAYILYRKFFRHCIIEAFEKSMKQLS